MTKQIIDENHPVWGSAYKRAKERFDLILVKELPDSMEVSYKNKMAIDLQLSQIIIDSKQDSMPLTFIKLKKLIKEITNEA